MNDSFDQPSAYQRVVTEAAIRIATAGGFDLMVDEIAAQAAVDPVMARVWFPDGMALCKAVAHDVIVRLHAAVTNATAAAPGDDPVAQYAALLRGHIDWCLDNPLCCGILLRYDVPAECQEVYQGYDSAMQQLGRSFLTKASAAGRLRRGMPAELSQIGGSAVLVGLARMISAGPRDHLCPHLTPDQLRAACAVALDQHLDGLFPERLRTC